MSCKIKGNKFVFTFDVGKSYIHFGDYDGKRMIHLRKERLTEFKQKFNNNEKCSIQFFEEIGKLSLSLDENTVTFKSHDDYCTIMFFECKYDLCKDAVLECIDYHLSFYK